ncbi:SPOR domain-containing protein [Halalkalibacter lacteus]|uniref:SPOR domain-containing protein n=1 Tax=Halalkalibacter lacteus TaxID=3090663 RepID=UPI002FC5BAF4
MGREKQTISVRLNGKEQKINEHNKDANVKDEVGATREHVVEDEAEIIPQPDNIIDFGKRQEERIRNGQPYWDDGFSEKSPKLPFNRKKKTHSGAKNPKFPVMLVVALFSAVVVGLSLGFMILTVFTGNPTSVTVEDTTTGAIPTFSDGGDSFPVLTLEVVQGGAFSDLAKGEEIVAQLKGQGVAGTLTKGTDPIYMFIGAGGDRAQANKVASLYESYGQDTYLKSFQVDGQAVTGQSEAVTAWFTNAIAHYKELLQLSVDALGGGSLLTPERLGQLTQSTDSLQAERDQAFTQLSQAAQVHALALGDNLVLAGDKLAAYVDSSDEKVLWQSQQALLDALVEYDQLVQAQQ